MCRDHGACRHLRIPSPSTLFPIPLPSPELPLTHLAGGDGHTRRHSARWRDVGGPSHTVAFVAIFSLWLGSVISNQLSLASDERPLRRPPGNRARPIAGDRSRTALGDERSRLSREGSLLLVIKPLHRLGTIPHPRLVFDCTTTAQRHTSTSRPAVRARFTFPPTCPLVLDLRHRRPPWFRLRRNPKAQSPRNEPERRTILRRGRHETLHQQAIVDDHPRHDGPMDARKFPRLA